jgi:hypothetical protein
MISDTLFEALHEIERYQRNNPDAYGGALAGEIEALKAHMRQVQAALDETPDLAGAIREAKLRSEKSREHAERAEDRHRDGD